MATGPLGAILRQVPGSQAANVTKTGLHGASSALGGDQVQGPWEGPW